MGWRFRVVLRGVQTNGDSKSRVTATRPMEMLEHPETGKKQREGRRCLSRAANIDKAGPPPSLPGSGACHESPEKEGGASPKHQWKREWAGSRLGAGGGACPAGPMRTLGAGRLLGTGARRMADALLFEFLHTEMVAELWAQDPDPGPGVSAGPRGEGGTGRGVKAGSRPREEQRARQRPGSNPRPCLAGRPQAPASASAKRGRSRAGLEGRS